MLSYEWMRIAFIAALVLGLALPLVGSTAVYKRLSSSGDALAHSSLAGVAIGLVSGLNPLLISIVCCVVSFLIIELLRKKFSKFSELGVAVVLSAAIGIAGILSRFAKSLNFDSYLFGSILLIKQEELIASCIIAAIVILFYIVFYRKLAATLYSETEAKVNGVHVGLLNFFHSLLLSITIAISAKVVGSLVVSSMLILPVAIALLFKKGYFMTLLIAVITSIASMLGGLTISYYADFAPGATIVSLSVVILVLTLLVRFIISLIKRKKEKAASDS